MWLIAQSGGRNHRQESLDFVYGEIDHFAARALGNRDALRGKNDIAALLTAKLQKAFEGRQDTDLATHAMASREHGRLQIRDVFLAVAADRPIPQNPTDHTEAFCVLQK